MSIYVNLSLSNTNNEQEKKSNMSAAQQILDLKEEIKNLKIDLRDRESKLQYFEDLLNKLIGSANVEASILHKDISKSINLLSDIITGQFQPALQQGIQQMNNNMSISDKTTLSIKFRQKQGLPILSIEEDK